jgi:hypothetical protein
MDKVDVVEERVCPQCGGKRLIRIVGGKGYVCEDCRHTAMLDDEPEFEEAADPKE